MFALRLASLILRNRTDAPLPPLRVTADAAGYTLELPREWLEENPLTEAALEAESGSWKAVGMKLAVTRVTERRAAQIAKLEVVAKTGSYSRSGETTARTTTCASSLRTRLVSHHSAAFLERPVGGRAGHEERRNPAERRLVADDDHHALAVGPVDRAQH